MTANCYLLNTTVYCTDILVSLLVSVLLCSVTDIRVIVTDTLKASGFDYVVLSCLEIGNRVA